MNDNSEDKTGENDMGNTINKHIRVDQDHWRRIEKAAQERGISPSRLIISATLEAIEGREWPHTEAEIHLLRSAMFAAQAIIRDMERAGREDEIEEISRTISEVAPKLPNKSAMDMRDRADSGSGNA